MSLKAQCRSLLKMAITYFFETFQSNIVMHFKKTLIKSLDFYVWQVEEMENIDYLSTDEINRIL